MYVHDCVEVWREFMFMFFVQCCMDVPCVIKFLPADLTSYELSLSNS